MSLTVNKIFTFTGHDAPVYALEVFDENTFFSGGGDRIVSCRELNTDSVAKAIVSTGSTIYSLKYIPEKNILLAGVSGGGLHVIDLIEKREIHFLLNHEKGIFDIKYSSRHNKIITAGGDGKISSWAGDTFAFQKSLSICSGKIRSIAIDKDENFAFVGCGDGTIRIIKIDQFQETNTIKAHDGSVNALCFHPYLNILISGGKDAHLNFWSPDLFELIHSIPAHNYAIYSIVFSPTGNYFSTGSRDKNIKIWNGSSFELLLRIDHTKNQAHTHSVNKTLWINDVLISAGDDRKIIGWKIIE